MNQHIDAISRTRPLTDRELRALHLSLGKGMPRRWDKAEDARLVRMFIAKRPLSTREMAAVLCRSCAAVNIRISFLRRQGRHLPGRRSWRNCDLKGVRG